MEISEVLITLLLFITIGVICSIAIFKDLNRRLYASMVVIIALVAYSLLGIIAYNSYLLNSGFILFPDQNSFYQISHELGKLQSISEIYLKCFVYNTYPVNKGAYFLYGVTAYIGNNYLFGNSILYQILTVCFFTSMINLFVFKILVHFVDEKKAFKYTVLYIFCSHIFFFSPWLLRDMQIALLFSIGFAILFSKFNIIKFIALIVLSVIIIHFRMASGLFYFMFPLAYVYVYSGKNLIVRFMIISGLIIILYTYLSTISIFLEETDKLLYHYSTSARDNNFGDGFSSFILDLPFGLKQIFIVVFSQIAPIPLWEVFSTSNSTYTSIIGIIQMISPIFWVYVWAVVLRSLFVKSFVKTMPKILLISFVLFVMYLLLNTSNSNPRRLLSMYPILFTIFVYAKEKIKYQTLLNKFGWNALMIFVFLYCFYGIIKL